jgi:hypothetical protein
MAQQPQVASQVVFGPASNGGGDIVHYIPANANANNAQNLAGWVDNNGLAGGVQGVTNGLAKGAPANVTAAAAATTIFSTTFATLPANSAYEGVPFTVKASGWLSLNGGTYTATVQPLIYGSTALGFTASAAAAVCSNAAASLTIAVAAAATLTYFPWEAEATVYGSTTSGILGGKMSSQVGPSGSIAPAGVFNAALVNSPTSITFNSATAPLNFLAGVVTVGAGISAQVVALTTLCIES